MENVFVMTVLMLSGFYISRRLYRIAAQGRHNTGCKSCASGTCGKSRVNLFRWRNGALIAPWVL